MGFFKKIGAGIKKATKQISFHNAVKLASMAVPGVGGSIIGAMQDAHDAKKANQQAEYEQAMATATAGTQTIAGDMLTRNLNALPETAKNSVANLGADLGNATLKVWFKRNWKYVVGGLTAFFLLIWAIVKFGKKGHSATPRKLGR